MLGWGMCRLAEEMGVHQSHLAHILEGEAITERMFLLLCKGLGIQAAEWDDWDELFAPKETPLQLSRKLRRNVTRREKSERPEKRAGRDRPRC